MYCPKCKQQVSGDICPNCGYKSAFKKMDDLGGTAPESPVAAPTVSAPTMPNVDKPATDGFKPMDSLTGEVKKTEETVTQDVPASSGFKPMDVLPGGESGQATGTTPTNTGDVPGVSGGGRATDPDNRRNSKPKNDAKSFNWKRWIPITTGLIAACLLAVMFLTGGKTSKDVNRINKEISSVEKAYLNEGKYVAVEEKDQLLNAVYQTVNELDTVTYCEKNDYSVYMILDNGLGMHYQAPISGLASSGADLQVYTYQPFHDEFTENTASWNEGGKLADRKGDYPDKGVNQLEKLDITADKAQRFYNQNVTLELLKTPPKNGVIVWVGHGGYSSKTHSTLLLTVEYTDALYKKYKDDFDNHRIEIVNSYPNPTICITPAFFEYHLASDALENVIIYLGTCESGKDDVLVSTLLGKGAATVYWNSGTIFQLYNNQMCRSIMEALCGGKSTGNALAIAQDKHGALDNVIFGLIKKNVWVGCSGNQHLTLQEMYDWANKQSNEATTPTPAPTQETTAPTEPVQTWPAQKELFNETYWSMAFGQSLGFHYSAKFSPDGTFVAYCFGSGEYKEGTYTYSNGELEIVFDLGYMGNLTVIQYSYDESNKSFTSHETYPMQVGEEHYSIWYLDDQESAAERFDDYKKSTEPPTEPTNIVNDNPYIGTWLSTMDFDGYSYTNEINLKKNGNVTIHMYDTPGTGGYEVWDDTEGTWKLKKSEGNTFWIELDVVHYDLFDPANQQQRTVGEAYTAVITMQIDGDSATIQLDSSEFPYIFYDYSFTRGEGVFSHN